MNFNELDVQSAQQNRPQVNNTSTTRYSPHTPTTSRFHDDRHSSVSSEISDETVIRWSTPPSRMRTPEQTSFETLRPRKQEIGVNEAAYASNTPLVVRFDEGQIRTTEAEASSRAANMEDDMEPYPTTPNTDDTPYIRFAIDQLTRDEEVKTNTSKHTKKPSTVSSEYPVERIVPDLGLGYMSAEREREAMRLVRKHRSSPPKREPSQKEGRLFRFNATRPLSYPSIAEPAVPIKPIISEIFIPVDAPQALRYPDLTFVPTILRPLSMIMLSLLCLLMTAVIIFCALFSRRNDGLIDWRAGIYGGRYFVFGFLPQILAALIFVYMQGVMNAMTRILPYTMMANDDQDQRSNALFIGIFPRSLLFPRWDGPMNFKIAHLVFWLSVFTIPLQSCLFSVVQVDGVWRWTAVQGVAWTLVGVYLLLLIKTVALGVFFFRRTTGLIWDPTSLADIVALLPRSNSLKDYPGTDVMKRKVEIKDRLSLRSDRLGYWRTQNRNQGTFYCIGEHGAATRRFTLSRGRLEKAAIADPLMDVEKASTVNNPQVRFRHIPWFLRDTFVILWAIAGAVFLAALFVISFLPSTAIRNGFRASVTVMPNPSGFSAANFLYSFIPSIIGMLLYILFQSFDMTMRKLQPWVDLSSPNGAPASKSLLLQYTALGPISCTISAIRNRHYRVVFLSLLSFLFIVLPILAGGLFFPLTTPTRQVRMIPNLPCFYIILALLVLYLIGLISLIPNRRTMHLPHSVDCLAEIFSFTYASGMMTDAPFRAPKSKADLVSRLNAVRAKGGMNHYGFGVYKAADETEVLGIDKMGRNANELTIVDPRDH